MTCSKPPLGGGGLWVPTAWALYPGQSDPVPWHPRSPSGSGEGRFTPAPPPPAMSWAAGGCNQNTAGRRSPHSDRDSGTSAWIHTHGGGSVAFLFPKPCLRRVCPRHVPWARDRSYSLIHSQAQQASAEALGPLLLQGRPPQEGHGRLELAGEGQACLQGTVIGAQVCVPVPVAWAGEESRGQCPAGAGDGLL